MATDFKLIEAFKATLAIYLEAAKDSLIALYRNPAIIVGSVGAYFLFMFAAQIFGPMGLGGGFILGMLMVTLLSYYYRWVSSLVNKDKLSLEELLPFDYGMFSGVLSVAFIVWIATWMVQSLTIGIDAGRLVNQIFNLIILFVFNSIPEIVMHNRSESIHALGEAAEFTKRNWIEWYIPFLIVISPYLLLSPMITLMEFTRTDVMLPVSMVINSPRLLLGYLNIHIGSILPSVLGLLVAHWFMIFRGLLFKELSSGSRRQRIYRSKF